jgi:two-component system, OmpR family, sensor kinase
MSPARDFTLPPEASTLFGPSPDSDFYFIVYSRSGSIFKSSTNAPPGLPQPPPTPDSLLHSRTRDAFRETYQFTGLGECILVGRSISTDLKLIERNAYRLLAAGSTVVFLGLAVGWLLTTRAIKPIETISTAATRISEGNLTERIQVANPEDELGKLARVLNATFARLESAFERQKQFTADASHELRTPLAVLISETQTTLTRDRSTAEYKDALQTCLDTAQQMRRLAESLLELSRADSDQTQSMKVTLQLPSEIAPLLERLALLASENNVSLQSDFQPAETDGNLDRIAQVFNNLVSNAIHYNRPGGIVHISTFQEEDHACLQVTDTGIGISAQDLPHIFERFYRADKSRARTRGHAGLGLAICKAIVEADGGTIVATSKQDEGSTFTVRWPRPRHPGLPSLQ